MYRSIILAAAVAFAAVSSASAHDVTAGSLKIEKPWVRATPKGARVGGGYMKITNTGTAADRLVGGESASAGRFEVHEMSMDGGVMKMRQLPQGLVIKPGETVEFKPGGYHVMFLDLSKPFTQGEAVKATLQFEKAGKVDVDFAVEGIGAQSGGDHSGGGHSGGMKH